MIAYLIVAYKFMYIFWHFIYFIYKYLYNLYCFSMSLTPLWAVDHFVHIGFHKKPTPEFDARLKQRLDAISWNVHHLVSFVDESKYFPEDVEELQIVFLAQSLTDFVHLCHLKWTMPIMREQFEAQKAQEINPQVRAYLEKQIDGFWQKLEKTVASFEEWKSWDAGKFWKLPENIKADIDAQDGLFKGFMANDFANVLEEMCKHFEWQNVYNIHTSVDVRNDDVSNPKRKQEIVSYAIDTLWEERVIFSGMRDGDMDKIVWAFQAKERDAEYEEWLKKAGITLEAYERMHGNASQQILDMHRKITLSRANRIAQKFFEEIKKRWYAVTPKTKHWLVGEYYGRCVSAYGSNLFLYRFPKDRIEPLEEFSLLHPWDK